MFFFMYCLKFGCIYALYVIKLFILILKLSCDFFDINNVFLLLNPLIS